MQLLIIIHTNNVAMISLSWNNDSHAIIDYTSIYNSHWVAHMKLCLYLCHNCMEVPGQCRLLISRAGMHLSWLGWRAKGLCIYGFLFNGGTFKFRIVLGSSDSSCRG